MILNRDTVTPKGDKSSSSRSIISNLSPVIEHDSVSSKPQKNKRTSAESSLDLIKSTRFLVDENVSESSLDDHLYSQGSTTILYGEEDNSAETSSEEEIDNDAKLKKYKSLMDRVLEDI